jgi:putative ABC transport system permease protein
MQMNYEAIRAQLLGQPGIVDVTSSNDNIISANNTTSADTTWDDNPNSSILIHPINVDRYYLNFFKVKIIEGDGFTGMATDTAHFILNETAVNQLGIRKPIGKRFAFQGVKGNIIGVTKDFHFASLKQKIEPAVFVYKPNGKKIFIRTTGKEAALALNSVERAWKNYNDGFPFDYKFMDEYFDSLYKSDVRSGTLFDIFTFIAIMISCLGLFGLVTYSAQVKIKEIGIRKVLGASVANITLMLSMDFLKLIIISMFIAIPISWFAMAKWLQAYTYRIHIQWWVFALAGLSSMLIAFITISFQAVKAAMANPVKSLKNE